MKIQAYAHTDIGRKRKVNEDRFLIDRTLGLYIVCDGMGGHAAGEVASENAARIVAEVLRTDRPDIDRELAAPGGHFRVIQFVVDAVRNACHQVHAMANSIPECAGMGTTLTLLLIADDKAILAHVGDSRLYLVREEQLHLLTQDHTLANEMIRTGQIKPTSEAATRFANVLTRSIGAQEAVDVETLLFDLHPGDRFLLCSDGLSNYLSDPQEALEILTKPELEDLPIRLTELANERGGQDNITCIAIDAVAEDDALPIDSPDHLNALRQTELFGRLKLGRLMSIANICDVCTFGPDEWIIRRGDQRVGMFVVVEGSCCMTKPSGEKVTLSTGDSFAETGLARDETSFLDVRTIGTVTLLHIQRDQFRQLVRRVPKLGRTLMENLAECLARQLDGFVVAAASLNQSGVWKFEDSEDSDESE